MRKLLMALGLATFAVFAFLSFSLVSAKEQSVTVPMNALNNSGQDGSATLTDMGEQTQVIIDIKGGGPGASQPAHVHVGACPDVGQVKYPLNNVVDGKSTTVVNAPLSDLLAGNLAINVHLSTQDIATYVSCGNIPAGGTPATLPKAGDETVPLVSVVVVIAVLALIAGFAVRARTTV